MNILPNHQSYFLPNGNNMSADFTKILVKDDRLEVVDNIKYAVVKGGQNVTMAQFRAISASDNQLVFNIQVPSEQTIIDRRVLLSTDLTLTITSKAIQWGADPAAPPAVATAYKPTSEPGCGYGIYSGLAPYPLHQLMTVASATINNNTVSINIRDVLPAIVRLLDKESLGSYNGMTSTATDFFQSYGDSVYSIASANGSAASSTLDTDEVGRGTLYLKNRRVSYAAGPDFTCTEVLTFHISEPLLLSPFIYCNPKSNAQGFYGIQNMNFVLNIGGTERVYRGLDGVNGYNADLSYNAAAVYASPAGQTALDGANLVQGASYPYITGVSKGDPTTSTGLFSPDTSLLFTFLTPHPSDLMPARNIVPYYELPRYITTTAPKSNPFTISSAQANKGIALNAGDPIDIQGGQLYATQTLQLNQIPDKLILYITKANKSWGDSDSFLPIRKVSIQFNNNSGILSAARCEDLYRMAKDNGSNQSWHEWVGCASAMRTCMPILAGATAFPAAGDAPSVWTGYSGVSSGPGTCGLVDVSTAFTSGSCMVLEFGKDIQLIEDFFAPGSLGNFNLQINVFADNNNPTLPVTAGSSALNIFIVTMNSGVFVCERGTSSTYTGILTRADVLEASEQDAYSHSDVKRMVGGGFLDMLKSGVSKLAPLVKAIAPVVAPMAKDYLKSKGAMGKLAAQGIGALGYGRSGAGPSGAGASGGALQGRYM
jgi:hypothetical protein